MSTSRELLVGFHLLGDQFYGSPWYPNIVPGSKVLNAYPEKVNGDKAALLYVAGQYLNLVENGVRSQVPLPGEYGFLEAFWRQAVDQKKTFKVTEELAYGSDNLMPRSFQVSFTISSKPFDLYIPNNLSSRLNPADIRSLIDAVK